MPLLSDPSVPCVHEQGTPRIVANSKGKKRRPSSKDLLSSLRCTDVGFVSFLEGYTPRETYH